MKKATIFFIVLISSAPLMSFFKSVPSDITGTWILTAYAYNPKGTQMNFVFVQNVKYVFNRDSTGKIINNSDTSSFTWLRKKNKLSIKQSSETKSYKIVDDVYPKLLIVDQNAGTDEHGNYVANEKGLVFNFYSR